MCKTCIRNDATDPTPPAPAPTASRRRSTADPLTSSTPTDSSAARSSSKASTSSTTSSLSGIRSSLPEKPLIYSFSEISSATNNFLSKRLSSSSSSAWRCSLRGKDVVVFQRKLHRRLDDLRPLLSSLCRNHHSSIIPLRGAASSGDNHIYLVYDFVPGASLSDTLRNSVNPSFTVLSTWLSRLQIAADLADGLHYMHSSSGLIHNRIKSSSVIVSDPHHHARICHFGTAQLTGELPDSDQQKPQSSSSPSSSSSETRRSRSGKMKVQGIVGYMAPEFSTAGIVSQKSDVYAFGVVLLELLSGEEPVKHRYDRTKRAIVTSSLIEIAREVTTVESERDDGRLRQWVDRRLRDSFPVDVAGKLVRLALDCVHVEADMRPDMERVAGKVSRMYLESKGWAEKMKVPTDFTVSMAPR